MLQSIIINVVSSFTTTWSEICSAIISTKSNHLSDDLIFFRTFDNWWRNYLRSFASFSDENSNIFTLTPVVEMEQRTTTSINFPLPGLDASVGRQINWQFLFKYFFSKRSKQVYCNSHTCILSECNGNLLCRSKF